MNKKELIEQVAASAEMTKKEAGTIVEAILAAIAEALKKGEEVRLTDFGTFVVRESAARQGRNPQSGETIKIAAKKRPAFKPAKALRDAVNAPAPKAKKSKKK